MIFFNVCLLNFCILASEHKNKPQQMPAKLELKPMDASSEPGKIDFR